LLTGTAWQQHSTNQRKQCFFHANIYRKLKVKLTKRSFVIILVTLYTTTSETQGWQAGLEYCWWIRSDVWRQPLLFLRKRLLCTTSSHDLRCLEMLPRWVLRLHSRTGWVQRELT
jgi:hypothetical protein